MLRIKGPVHPGSNARNSPQLSFAIAAAATTTSAGGCKSNGKPRAVRFPSNLEASAGRNMLLISLELDRSDQISLSRRLYIHLAFLFLALPRALPIYCIFVFRLSFSP